MSATKLAWNGRDTKHLSPPRFEKFDNDPIVQQYCKRDKASEHLSLLEWGRNFIFGSKRNKQHKQTALVAVRFNSVYHNQYFFQDVTLNCPFRCLDDLLHPRHNQIPDSLKFFAAAQFKLWNRWSSDEALRKRLTLECNKDYYIDNVSHYVRSLRDLFTAWEQGLLSSELLSQSSLANSNISRLQGEQVAAFERIKSMVLERKRFYSNVGSILNITTDPSHITSTASPNWTKIFFIEGRPGTGKSHLVREVTKWA